MSGADDDAVIGFLQRFGHWSLTMGGGGGPRLRARPWAVNGADRMANKPQMLAISA